MLKELECIHIIVADDGLKWSTSLANGFGLYLWFCRED